jgi:hypothetical protein
MNRDGAAVVAIGKAIANTRKESKRNVHLGPIEVKRKRIKGEKTSPPTPAPDRMNPMAEPR